MAWMNASSSNGSKFVPSSSLLIHRLPIVTRVILHEGKTNRNPPVREKKVVMVVVVVVVVVVVNLPPKTYNPWLL